MDNHTLPAINSTKGTSQKSTPFVMVYIAFEFISLALHGVLQYIIYKRRLNDKQYYLIRMLSIIDSLTVVIGFIVTLALSHNRYFMISWMLLLYILYTLSLMVTVFIAIDRWMAVKYALRYHALVTKRKFNAGIAVAAICTTIILSCLFFIDGGNNSVTMRNRFYTNKWALSYLVTLRVLTCVILLTLGKLTIKMRNASEANRPRVENLHGTEAEKLDIIVKLTRSIKDVVKLNLWTCVFLIPTIASTFILSLDFQKREELFRLNVFFSLVYLISNPITYLTCFTKIRKYWYPRLLRRINDRKENEETPQNANNDSRAP